MFSFGFVVSKRCSVCAFRHLRNWIGLHIFCWVFGKSCDEQSFCEVPWQEPRSVTETFVLFHTSLPPQSPATRASGSEVKAITSVAQQHKLFLYAPSASLLAQTKSTLKCVSKCTSKLEGAFERVWFGILIHYFHSLDLYLRLFPLESYTFSIINISFAC